MAPAQPVRYAVALVLLTASPALAKDTNVLIPTQDEAIEVVQAGPAACPGARRGEAGLAFKYGRAAVYLQRYLLFDGGKAKTARYLARVCLKRQTLAAGERRVSQGSVALNRGDDHSYLLQEGQCILLNVRRLSIALTGLPVIDASGKQAKRDLRGTTVCLRRERR